jgi:formylglycine-generating enzyme required for sulfatase activity
MAGEALNVFISYSHRDEGLKNELVNLHLKPLKREGKINTWQDRDIEAGAEWATEIKTNLEKADIVLLLITRHFLASDYCYEKEMQRAVQRHYEGTARVVPIILEICGWKYSHFKQLQVLPTDGKPVTDWDSTAKGFYNVEEGIRRVIDTLYAERRQAEVLKREQEAARLEQEQQQREKLAAVQRQREAAEAQRQQQKRLEQERLAAEQRQQEQAEAQRLEQARLEQDRQQQERLAIEQRLREQTEAQRIEQEHQQQELKRIEQEQQQQEAQKELDSQLDKQDRQLQKDIENLENVRDGASFSLAEVEPVDSNDKPKGKVEPETPIEKITIWEVSLNRRSTLLWLAGGIGGLLVWEAISKKRVSQSNQIPNNFENSLKLKIFSFPVISLNAQGKEIRKVQKENKYFVEDLGQGIELDIVAVPSGSFIMGSPDDEGYAEEKPQHQVMVKAFYIGKFPITQAQWKSIAAMPKVQRELNSDPSTFKGLMRPVEEVSWYDAVEFCQRLSRYTNRQYRLPNEAEWEYACRAGTTTPFSFGATITTDLANYNGNYNYGFASKGMMRQETTEVGSFSPNAFGLYDMHGNVWEWCDDYWHGDYYDAPKFSSSWLSYHKSNSRLLRGGSWYDDPRNCRSASRYSKDPSLIGSLFSFRVVWVPA